MSLLLSPIELSDAEKLEILQRLDRYRKWQSLNEKRYCPEEESLPRRKIIVTPREKFTARLRKFAIQFRPAA